MAPPRSWFSVGFSDPLTTRLLMAAAVLMTLFAIYGRGEILNASADVGRATSPVSISSTFQETDACIAAEDSR